MRSSCCTTFPFLLEIQIRGYVPYDVGSNMTVWTKTHGDPSTVLLDGFEPLVTFERGNESAMAERAYETLTGATHAK